MQDAPPVTPFYLQNLIATVPGASLPTTDFGANADIALSWDSNGTAFTVYAAQDSNPVYSGTATSCVVSGGRTRSTTFILAASVSGGPTSGTPSTSFDTIYLYDTLTVTISDPVLTPGALTTTDLTVTGALTASGATTLGAVSASTLSVANGLAMLTSIALPPVSAPVSYVATTDGLVIGTVTGDNSGPSVANISGSAGGMTVQATGGTVSVQKEGSTEAITNNSNSFVLPVQQGQTWTVSASQALGTPVPTAFYWVPFGANATLQPAGTGDAAVLGDAPPSAPSTPASAPPARDQAIAELLDVIAAMAGESATPEALARVAQTFRALLSQ